MDWLNYHHLLYFWTVVREGGLAPAAKKLHVAQPTLSTQIHALEDSLGEALFAKQGRRLVPTEMGRVVCRYADEIFGLGRELLATVQGRPTGRPQRLRVGIADAVPKLIVRRLLESVRSLDEPVRLVCVEGKPEQLVTELAVLTLDVVLSDSPIQAPTGLKAYHHLLGESPVTLFAGAALARRLKAGFPRSLDGAPFLLPTDNAALRRALDQWFEENDVRPDVIAEFEDSALLAAFGQEGSAVFVGSSAIEREIAVQYDVRRIARLASVRERFYAITVERRIKHPGVVAISEVARQRLFRARPR
jgi:LysR family transcriptional activator of nhaA